MSERTSYQVGAYCSFEQLESRLLLSGTLGQQAIGLLAAPPAELTVSVVDSDGDGVPDGWESDNGLTVGLQDAFVDFNGNGLLNFEEWLRDSDPVATAYTAEGLAWAWEASSAKTIMDVEAADFDRDGKVDIATLSAAEAIGWNPVESMSEGRQHHSAIQLTNGTVLIAGGLNSSGILSDCELYVR